jgi:hypothetical protein
MASLSSTNCTTAVQEYFLRRARLRMRTRKHGKGSRTEDRDDRDRLFDALDRSQFVSSDCCPYHILDGTYTERASLLHGGDFVVVGVHVVRVPGRQKDGRYERYATHDGCSSSITDSGVTRVTNHTTTKQYHERLITNILQKCTPDRGKLVRERDQIL